MNLKLTPLLVISYFLLVLVFLKIFSVLSVILFLIAFAIDYFTNIKSGIKNLLYFLASSSVFQPLFYIFLIYIPFSIFGLLLRERNFIKSYILGFTISLIPSVIIYLISTYLTIPLKIIEIIVIFYILPIMGIFILKKKTLGVFELKFMELLYILIIFFFTVLIGIKVLDNENLFMANHAREFYRIENIFNGLNNNGLIPIYDPAMGLGEATYLWVPPSALTNIALVQLFLKFIPPILFVNAHLLFMLFLSTIALGLLFFSILNKEYSTLNFLAVISTTLLIGLNFFSLQSMESVKIFYAYPVAYLFLSLIIQNPITFKEFLILMFISSFIVTLHPAYGIEVLMIAIPLFLLCKLYYYKNREEIVYFLSWIVKNKLKIFIILAIIVLLPLFYISASFLFTDYYVPLAEKKLTFNTIKLDIISYFKEFYSNEIHYLSLDYPDLNRMDEHKFGFFISVFGVLSFLVLITLYKAKETKNFRMLVLSYLIYLILLSLIRNISLRVGGLFRVAGPYLLIILGASILLLSCISKIKFIKVISISIIFIAFLHTIPSAMQLVGNIHKEAFMGGNVYKNEIEFLKSIPTDGRIMTYGLFNNVIDFGVAYHTGRYGSRSERTETTSERSIWEKIHGQNSFGEPDQVLTKSGIELSNYLRLGGYKYVFMNLAHPIANYVTSQIYPNFSYPIYQNGPLVFLVVNNTNYAEKVDLIENIDEEIYKKKDGYKYVGYSKLYNFDIRNISKKDYPMEPQPLKFERLSPTKVIIYGNFNDNEWVVFKEQYFSRWKAYINSKAAKVLATNFDLILIRTLKGDNIILEYSILAKEKLIGMLSIAGYLGLSIMIIFLLKETY